MKLTLKLGAEAALLAGAGGLLFLLFLFAGQELGPDQAAELLPGALLLLLVLLFIDFLLGLGIFLPLFRDLGRLEGEELIAREQALGLWKKLVSFPGKAVLVSLFMWSSGTLLLGVWVAKKTGLEPLPAAVSFSCCWLLGCSTAGAYFFRAKSALRPFVEQVHLQFLAGMSLLPRGFGLRFKLISGFIFVVVPAVVSLAGLCWLWREQVSAELAWQAGVKTAEETASKIRKGKLPSSLESRTIPPLKVFPFVVDYRGNPLLESRPLTTEELELIKTSPRFLGDELFKEKTPLRASLCRFFERFIPLPEILELRFGELGPDAEKNAGSGKENHEPGKRWLFLQREPLRGGLYAGALIELVPVSRQEGKSYVSPSLALAIIAVVLIGMALLYALWIADDLEKPLKNLKEAIESAPETGLPRPAAASGDDEIAELVLYFNRMRDSLAEKTGQVEQLLEAVKSAAADLDRAASSMMKVAADQASGASEQAAGLHQISTTSEEIAATLRRIAENAKSVEELSGETLTASSSGRERLEELHASMEAAKEQAQEVAAKMLSFQEQAEKIENILGFLRELSGRINLLALNASIEASAVGDAGERFSIVASEMRKLAEQSAEGTARVQKVVTELQETMSGAVLATEEGEKKVIQALNAAGLAGEAFQRIVHWASETARSAQEISVSTRQQTTATEHLAAALVEIQEVAEKFAAGAKDLETTMSELDRTNKRLARLLGSGKEHSDPEEEKK